MKAFSNYNETQVFTESQKIPAGAYIVTIKAAEVKEFSGQNGTFEKLEISFDIAEGEYKDYYANQYRGNTDPDKKWKGRISIFVPTDDGSEKDLTTKRRFKTVIEAIEESNNGYRWDWNESGLRGKKCGVVLQNKEWEWSGKTGWSAVPYSIVSVEAVRSGNFYMPKDKPLNNGYSSTRQPVNTSDIELLDDDSLPF